MRRLVLIVINEKIFYVGGNAYMRGFVWYRLLLCVVIRRLVEG